MNKDYRKNKGALGEQLVLKEIKALKNNGIINDFFSSKNIKFFNHNFQIDILAFSSKIGLVVIEVKNWSGEVLTSLDSRWQQNIGKEEKKPENASLQCLKTANLFMRFLEYNGMNKWTIRPLVVFADRDAVIKRSEAERPQTDIILTKMIPDWFAKNALADTTFSFTKEVVDEVKGLMSRYTKSYYDNKDCNGYCILCGETSLEYNKRKPYCPNCYRQQRFYNNTGGGYCHKCGLMEDTRFDKPLCLFCFRGEKKEIID